MQYADIKASRGNVKTATNHTCPAGPTDYLGFGLRFNDWEAIISWMITLENGNLDNDVITHRN